MGQQNDSAVFVSGMWVYPPHENAPDFILADLSIDRDSLMAWLREQDDKLRITIKRSKAGKLYAQLAPRSGKPRGGQTPASGNVAARTPAPTAEIHSAGDLIDDDIPF